MICYVAQQSLTCYLSFCKCKITIRKNVIPRSRELWVCVMCLPAARCSTLTSHNNVPTLITRFVSFRCDYMTISGYKCCTKVILETSHNDTAAHILIYEIIKCVNTHIRNYLPSHFKFKLAINIPHLSFNSFTNHIWINIFHYRY